MIKNTLAERLSEQKINNLYRTRHLRSAKTNLINFSSNDYLSLSQHPEVIKSFQDAAEKYGVGSGASQLVTGHTELHHECEIRFAEFLKRDRALLFGNGYMANLGVLNALTQTGDSIYQDRHNHASLLDAGRISTAKSQRYQHLNVEDLKRRISCQNTGKKWIVSDAVFSMQGDIAPLDLLSKTSHEYNATLMIDDAHGIGVLGQNGRGTLDLFQLTQKDISILICPLGKAFGVYGAIVAGSNDLIEACIQFSRSYIYTTALPPALAAAAIKSLELVEKDTWRHDKLNKLISHFKIAAKERGLRLITSNTAIQSIKMDSPNQALEQSKVLKNNGYWVCAMRPPTVPDKQSLLRITLNVEHTETQINTLLDMIS